MFAELERWFKSVFLIGLIFFLSDTLLDKFIILLYHDLENIGTCLVRYTKPSFVIKPFSEEFFFLALLQVIKPV